VLEDDQYPFLPMGKFPFSPIINRPSIPLVLALMTGLVLGTRGFDPYPAVLPWCLIFLLLILPIVLLLFPSAAIWTGCGFFFVTGLSLVTFLSPQATTAPVPSFLVNSELQHLSGEMVEEPVLYPDKTRLTIRLTSYSDRGQERPAQGIILLGVKEPLKEFGLGDPVRFVCRLRFIEGYHNPGGFDLEKKMARRGIKVSGFLENSELLVLGGPNQRVWPLNRLSGLRNRVSDLIDSRISSPFNGLAQALLTGDQSKIPGEIKEAFSRAGVSHLLAFSGLNLGLVGGLAFFLFRFLLSLSEKVLLFLNVRKWALISSFFPVLGYALLAGLSPSAARALFMVGMVILALLLQKYSDLLNSLALTALVLLLISPESLFFPSFQLSFLSVWAIGFLLPRIWNPPVLWEPQKSIWKRRVFFYLWTTFCVSLVCQLATSPLVIWWFHQVSLVGIFSNIVLVPLTGIIVTPLGLLALILSPISSWLSSGLFWIMEWSLRWTVGLTGFFADFPFSFLIVPTPGYGEISFYYLTLALAFHWRKIPKPCWLISISFLGMLLFFFSPPIRNFFLPTFRATFLDVGHGSSTLIEFPGGAKMLIDGGGTFNPEFDLGERVVAPFLWGKKITGLDVVVLTHPHPDHLNGLPFILSKFKVKEIWLGRQRGDTEAYYHLEDLIRKNGIRVIFADAGWAKTFSDVRVEVLYAPKEAFPDKEASSLVWHEQNNHSLVLRLSQNDQHILFPADIEAGTERTLLAKRVPLKSQILQVPHHGSRTSSTVDFIEAVDPAYAIISGRPTPRFPLPHPEVIKRYQEKGVKVLRTDQHGALIFTLKKDQWKVESHLNGPLTETQN
jgi:competence protein ComEC